MGVSCSRALLLSSQGKKADPDLPDDANAGVSTSPKATSDEATLISDKYRDNWVTVHDEDAADERRPRRRKDRNGSNSRRTDGKMEDLAEQYMHRLVKKKADKRKARRQRLMLDTASYDNTLNDIPVVDVTFADDEDVLEDDGYFSQRERQTFEKPRPEATIDMPITWRRAERLGNGAFGSVYLALNVETGELMGVKQIPLSTNRSENTEKQLLTLRTEITVMASLAHDNIVRYISSETTPEFLNIFLEFVPGGSISSLLKKFGSFNEKLVRMYTKQILNGLAYLHSHQIMHRDIKGANILVDTQGVCKLADFGASTRLADLSLEGRKSMHGTPYWMAPEVIKQTGHGRQADIWSVGCTVIEMCTGLPPWHNYKTQVSIMFHIATTDEMPEMPAGLSAEGVDFIKQCLIRDPKKRPNSLKLLNHPFLQPYTEATPRSRAASGSNSQHHHSRGRSSSSAGEQTTPSLFYNSRPNTGSSSGFQPTPKRKHLEANNDIDVIQTYLDQTTSSMMTRVQSVDQDIYKSYRAFAEEGKRKRTRRQRKTPRQAPLNPHDSTVINSMVAQNDRKEIQEKTFHVQTVKERQQAQWEAELDAELRYQKTLKRQQKKDIGRNRTSSSSARKTKKSSGIFQIQ